MRRCKTLAWAAGALLAAATARADVKFSEIFFDSPGSTDLPDEYVELKGTPGVSMQNYYVVILENEIGSAGQIDAIFDLGVAGNMGTNGYTVFRMIGADPAGPGVHTNFAPGTNVRTNAGNTGGFGYAGAVGGSTVGYYQSGPQTIGRLENGGFSAFVVHVEGGITSGGNTIQQIVDNYDLDANNDGLDTNVDYSAAGAKYLYNNSQGDGKQWEILDSIGQTEVGENASTVRLYAKINFVAEAPDHAAPTLNTVKEDGATNIFMTTPYDGAGGSNRTPLEPEYLGRWAGSTGTEASDYVMANVTNSTSSGFVSANRWRDGFNVSGQHLGLGQYGEFYHGTQEDAAHDGQVIQNTMGRPNYPVPDGDLSQNTVIDQADLDIVLAHWQNNDPNTLGYWLGGDPVANGIVDKADLDWVMDRWPAYGSGNFTTPDFGFLAGDVNLDGLVNRADLSTFALHWNQVVARGYANADFTYDGKVDIRDLQVLLRNWGYGGGGGGGGLSAAEALMAEGFDPSAVPEPATISIAFMGAIPLLRRRSRSARQ